MKIQLLTARQNLFLLLLGIFIVVFTWVFLWPKVNQVFERRKTLEEEKVRLEKLKTKLADLKGLNEFELSKRAEMSLGAIPAEKNVLDVLGHLAQLASAQSLTVESFQVAPDKLEFQLGLVGNSENLVKFLAAAEKSLPLIDIGKIKITTHESIAEANLTLVSFFLSLPSTLGSLDSPVLRLTSDEQKILQTLSEFGVSSVGESFLPGQTGKSNPFVF